MSHASPTWNTLSESVNVGLTFVHSFFSNNPAPSTHRLPCSPLPSPHTGTLAQPQHLYSEPLSGGRLHLPSPTISSPRAAGSVLSLSQQRAAEALHGAGRGAFSSRGAGPGLWREKDNWVPLEFDSTGFLLKARAVPGTVLVPSLAPYVT